MSDFNLINKPSVESSQCSATDYVMMAKRPNLDAKITLTEFMKLQQQVAPLAVQTISVTGNVNVTAPMVVCTGSTTAPQLPAVVSGLYVSIKNMGSGNCVIAGTGSAPIVPVASVSTGATTLTLATTTQAILFCDGTNWYQLA